MAVNEQGHYGKYSGNARHSYNHAHTRVTKANYKDAVKDDAAHIDYLKRDVLYDAHHGHSDIDMTADEKHISKLAGDMKYDKKHHGAGKHHGPGDFQGNLHAAQEKHSKSGEHLGKKADAPAKKKISGPAKVDPKKLKEIAGQLKQASAMHKGQAKKIDSMLKSLK